MFGFPNFMKLSEIKQGCNGIIYENCDNKSCVLGLHEDSEFSIFKNDFTNPIILKVKGSKLAIGQRLAQTILVR
jgi:Fe2+ transport system protein FeoA